MPVTTAHRTPDKESITELVHAFYADVRKDDLLGPVFDKALHGQWDAHLHRLVDFWSTVLLGARSFKGKRAATVRPVLDALTGIGMARRLKDGRYAA